MPPSVHPDTVVVQFAWRLREADGDLDRLDRRLCEEGFTHVAIYLRGAEFLLRESAVNPISQADYDILQRWTARHEKVWEDKDGWYEMYWVGCRGGSGDREKG
jgi:hypothetical protein